MILKDTNGEGKADNSKVFGNFVGTDLAIGNVYFYDSSDSSVIRSPMKDGFPDETELKTIVTRLEVYKKNSTKSLALMIKVFYR
jgi:hypothetical protein